MAFFNKKENLTTPINLLKLHNGSQFEYDAKIWTVRNIADYDWGDSQSIEYKIEAMGEIAFLEVENNDGILELFITKEISLNLLDKNIHQSVKDTDSAPQNLLMNGYKFTQTDDYGGFCTNRDSHEKDEIYVWEYTDKSRNLILTVEQWDDDEFEASFGTKVHEHEISNPNNNMGDRFS